MSRETFSKSEIERIRDTNKISDVIGQFVTWDRKKSSPRRGDMWACCPFHGEKRPSFHCEDSKGRYHCFGCGVSGDAFKFLMEKTGCSFRDAVAQLGGREDIQVDPEERRKREEATARKVEADRHRQMAAEEDTREFAKSIWDQAVSIDGTPAERYLRGRGIAFPLNFPSLRFHPRLKCQQGDKVAGFFPALVAEVQAPDDDFLAIWRIFITDEGKKAPVDNAKLGLGNYTAAGGAVRLGDPGAQANVCEGIETGLGIYGITGGVAVQCALSTSGMVNFVPPSECDRVLIWPDGDVDRFRQVNGEERFFQSPGIKAATELRDRLRGMNYPADVQPTPKRGLDYLDLYQRMNRRTRHGAPAA